MSKELADLMLNTVPENYLMEWVSEKLIPRFNDCTCTKCEMTRLHLEDACSTYFTLKLLEEIHRTHPSYTSLSLEADLLPILNEARALSNELRLCIESHIDDLSKMEEFLSKVKEAEKKIRH